MLCKVLLEMENKEALDTLSEIRTMMNRSSKFLSLSGLSAILIGIYACIGAAVAYMLLGENRIWHGSGSFMMPILNVNTPYRLRMMVLLAAGLLVVCLGTVVLFTYLKAKGEGRRLKFDHTTSRFLFNFFLPLVVGGVLCVALLTQQYYGLTSAVMLIFYGLALVNASSYTYSHTRYLGYAQLILGMVNSFVYGHGLLFWVFGFGILHIVYGLIFCWKYERWARR